MDHDSTQTGPDHFARASPETGAELDWQATASSTIRSAVAAATDQRPGVREQSRSALDSRPALALMERPSDVGESVALAAPLEGVKPGADTRLGFDFHWLCEAAAGKISGDLGLKVMTGAEAALDIAIAGALTAVVTLDDASWLRVRVFKRNDSGARFPSAISVTARPSTPLPEGPEDLAAAILGAGGPERLNDIEPAVLESVVTLVRSVYAKAIGALEAKYSAEVSYFCERATAAAALVDCSFDFTPDGLEAYRLALTGDFSRLLAAPSAHVRMQPGLVTQGLRRCDIELHLPFFDRKQWPARWEALAKLEISDGRDGRLLAYSAEASGETQSKNAYQSTLALVGALAAPRQCDFTLTYTDCRTLGAAHARAALGPILSRYGFGGSVTDWLDSAAAASGAGELEALLTLSLEGRLAGAWLRAPAERDPDFFEVYSAVSVAVQQALRKWLPYVYFSDLAQYDNNAAAYPLVVYGSTRPFAGKPRSEFTYDVMVPDGAGLSKRPAVRNLSIELERIERLLTAAGKVKTARFYAPRYAPDILAAVQRQPRLLNALLAADAVLVDNFVKLGVRGRELSDALANDPQRPVRDLVKFAGEFVTVFHRKLRRLYGGHSFIAFGSLLLIEATRALNKARNVDASIVAVLRLAMGQRGQPNRREQTFVNPAYRP